MNGPDQVTWGRLQTFPQFSEGRLGSRPTDTVEGKKPSKDSDVKLQKACSELESLFIYQLFQEMRKTVNKSGFIDEGSSGEMVTSMLDMELSKELAAQKGFGLAAVIYEQLKNYQHAAET
jgi:flagellar protein FlgJ